MLKFHLTPVRMAKMKRQNCLSTYGPFWPTNSATFKYLAVTHRQGRYNNLRRIQLHGPQSPLWTSTLSAMRLDIVQLHSACQWRHSACAPPVVGLDPQMCSLHLCTQTQQFVSCFLCLPCIVSGTKLSIFPVLGALQTRLCPDKEKEVENGPRTQRNPVTDKPEIQHLCPITSPWR